MGKVTILFKKFLQGLLEMLAIFPILFLFGIYLKYDMSIGLFFLFIYLLYIAGAVLRGIFNIKKRLVELLIGLGIIFLITYTHGLTQFKSIIFSILGIVSYFRGIFSMESEWEDIFPRHMWWISLIGYMLAGVFYSRINYMKEYMSYILVFGFIQVIVSLFMLNFRQLSDATLIKDKKPKIPSSIKMQNAALLILTFLIIAIITSFNTIKETAKTGIKSLFTWIIAMLDKLSSLLLSEDMAEELPREIQEFPMEGTPNPRHPIVEKILYILGIVITIIGIIVLLYGLYKGIKKLMGIISKWIKGFFIERELYEENYGYIDEKESLIDMEKIKEKYMEKIKSFIDNIMDREPKWEDLETNADKIRYIYRGIVFKYIKSGYRYKAYMTPNEIGEDIEKWCRDEEKDISVKQIISLYNKARYGDGRDIDDKEMEQIYKNIIDKDGTFVL